MKKNTFGYRTVAGGYSDPELTHVILTKSEYDEMLRDKARAEQKTRDTEQEARTAIQKTREDAQQRINSCERELASERAESSYQRRLNENLLRICKERANADRGLKPKKGHTGYVVASSAEKVQRYKEGRYWREVILWETVLQSPYSVDFTEEQARRQMLEELFRKNENDDWVIGRIGITAVYSSGYAEMTGDKKWRESHHGYNVMLERRLRANFRSGYWEIIFMHTKPLEVIPKDMRMK